MKIISDNQPYTQSRFKKGKITCPVCNKTHHYHCSITEDGGLVLCNRWSGRQASDGRYIHILTGGNNKSFFKKASPPVRDKVGKKADADRLDAVYRILLSHLRLMPTHANSLLNERGLSDTTIAYNLYASVPDKARGNRLARAMTKLGFNLSGVPGFYIRDGQWMLNTVHKGFYIPFRDEQGRIVALQVRRDSKQKPKYVWLTSVDEPEGASPNSPLHYVKPDIAQASGQILITEGALKGDCISEFEDIPILALAGVTAMSSEKLVSQLRETLSNLKSVIIGFDMDWQDKTEVKSALMRLINRFQETALEVKIRTWDKNLGKGLDDVLFNIERKTV